MQYVYNLEAMGSARVLMKFSYTCCMVLYSTLTYDAVQVPQDVYAKWKVT